MLIIGFGGFSQDSATGEILWNDVDSAMFHVNSCIAKHIAENHIGGVILFNQAIRDGKTKEFIRWRNILAPEQLAKLNQDLQTFNRQARKEQGLESLPLFISVDEEGGYAGRLLYAQGFPLKTLRPQELGAKEERVRDLLTETCNYNITQETYIYAKKLAQEIYGAHFNLNLAPVVDVNVNPLNPIIGGLGRSFSARPHVVINQARQFIRAFNEAGIITTLKHFPGHGSSTGDSHKGMVDVTKTYIRDIELAPYYTLIGEGYDNIVMTTHVINGNIDQTQCKEGDKSDFATWCPATMSKKTLTDLLRKEMGFKGLVISDDITMGAIVVSYPLKVVLEKAVNAGVDMFIIANNDVDQTDEVITTLAELVEDGAIAPEKIDGIYARIINFKRNNLLHRSPG